VKTLPVEDDGDKRQHIARVLSSVAGFNVEDIEVANDAFTARRLLATITFDLLILDIALPSRLDGEPEPDVGLLLLEELTKRQGAFRMPSHIIGITAYEDIFARAGGQFASYLLTLVYYDPGSDEWELRLQARVRNILDALLANVARPHQYECELAVVCALDSPELSSVLALPWKFEQVSIPNDHTIYWRGAYNCPGGERNVYATACPRMGMPVAAVIATKMIERFRPRYIAITGMTAGIRDKVEIGDILAADPTWDWGSGKWVVENGEHRFLPAPRQLPLDVTLRAKLRSLGADTAGLNSIRAAWPGERPAHNPTLRVGPVASGASVLADQRTAQAILANHRELVGIEMETYAIFAAAEEASAPRPTALSLKSVVDFADGVKNDRFQPYSSFVSARALQLLAEKYL
jgi:nucleoside phosphorylase/CheY-like chemotaxis protein